MEDDIGKPCWVWETLETSRRGIVRGFDGVFVIVDVMIDVNRYVRRMVHNAEVEMAMA